MSKEKTNVEEYKFEPIKGYPMLNWRGKRSFTSTQYYPAQLKETYGDPSEDGWMNKIFWGDNLQVMSHLLKEFRGKVNLIYIDPPFDSNADYKKKIRLRGENIQGDVNGFEEKQYSDIWSNDEYLQFMYERLILAKELLAENGIFILHCDWHKNHHLRCIMDEVFGEERFVNQIVWQKIRTKKAQTNGFGNVHDTVLVYSKNKDFYFNPQYVEFDEKYIKSHYKEEKGTGRLFRTVSLLQSGQGPKRKFGDKVMAPPPGMHWIWSQDRIDEAIKNNRIRITSGGRPEKIQYLDEMKGDIVTDIWSDIFPINSQAIEAEGYPTQKPVSLLQRLVDSFSKENDIVFDFFMGSGTTPLVCNDLRRRYLGADINLGAIQIASKRISKACKSENIGFQVLSVNNYELFRNPVEAKNLILESLEINPLINSIYDGEKNSRMVKVLPVNRISTRADLNELINGFDYKVFNKRKEAKPNKPVEKILLVCMGHEADLKAGLELAVKEAGFDIDVEVVDILRDNSNLEFKRDAEAKIKIKKNKLVIEKFYPMNLLQKLSLQKSKVDDWKELTESVMIDWNYDGAVLSPSVVDIPDKKELVEGEYEIPEDAGTIRVKITDLLSESLEIEVQNG